MSSSQSRGGGERMIHQDFIARIRYSNALPPPPNPPKLLGIPNTGLASGQYTNPGFASRLAREQPLNIEADAELGMPLDLVGMPGIFDGDESSIQAPAHPPAVHPHDRALLRPLASLGRPKVAESSVSFLRRTEYISALANKRADTSPAHASPRSAALARAQSRQKKRAAPEPASDSPAAIRRRIEKSFEVADHSLKHYKDVRHPTNRSLRCVDAYPLLPDPDGFPDSGAYVAIKFMSNPVPKSHTYDTRLLSGLLRPLDRSPAEEAAYEAALAAHALDPAHVPPPPNTMNYDLYLPETPRVGEHYRARFESIANGGAAAEYTSENSDGGCFHFSRLRAYETDKEREYTHLEKYDAELLLTFREEAERPAEGEDKAERPKAVFYYPVMQVSQIRPQRTKNIARTIGLADDEEQVVDQLDVTLEEPGPEVKEAISRHKAFPYGPPEDDEDERVAGVAEEEEGPAENGNGRRRAGSGSGTPSDQDAEGDEED